MCQAKETFKYLRLGYIHIILKKQNKNKNLIDGNIVYVQKGNIVYVQKGKSFRMLDENPCSFLLLQYILVLYLWTLSAEMILPMKEEFLKSQRGKEKEGRKQRRKEGGSKEERGEK